MRKVEFKTKSDIFGAENIPNCTTLTSNTQRVYWVEKSGYPNFSYTVHSGYVLAFYKTRFGGYFIVSLGDFMSCVVRHILADDLFADPSLANARCLEMVAMEKYSIWYSE